MISHLDGRAIFPEKVEETRRTSVTLPPVGCQVNDALGVKKSSLDVAEFFMYGCARIVDDESIASKFSSLLNLSGNNCSVANVRSCLVDVSERLLEVATLETSDTLVESRLP
jgi:hypothetical protein